MRSHQPPTDRENKIDRAVSLLHQYGSNRATWIANDTDLQLDMYGWIEAHEIIAKGQYDCPWCNNNGPGDCKAY